MTVGLPSTALAARALPTAFGIADQPEQSRVDDRKQELGHFLVSGRCSPAVSR